LWQTLFHSTLLQPRYHGVKGKRADFESGLSYLKKYRPAMSNGVRLGTYWRWHHRGGMQSKLQSAIQAIRDAL
jgi:hypothetical protein